MSHRDRTSDVVESRDPEERDYLESFDEEHGEPLNEPPIPYEPYSDGWSHSSMQRTFHKDSERGRESVESSRRSRRHRESSVQDRNDGGMEPRDRRADRTSDPYSRRREGGRQRVSCSEHLDRVANAIERDPRQFGLNDREAQEVCYALDDIADTLDQQKEAVVLERPDEGDTQQINQNFHDAIDYYNEAIIEREPDEPYMKEYLDNLGNQFVNPGEGEVPEDLLNQDPVDVGEWTPDDEDGVRDETRAASRHQSRRSRAPRYREAAEDIQVSVDGNAPISLERFLDLNSSTNPELLDEWERKIRDLEPGESFTVGGGAAAGRTITREASRHTPRRW